MTFWDIVQVMVDYMSKNFDNPTMDDWDIVFLPYYYEGGGVNLTKGFFPNPYNF